MTVNTGQTIELVKGALASPDENGLAKAYTQASGLVNYDLQPAALSLYPVLTPLRNTIPRVGANGGLATNWKAITAINPSRFSGGVSEGNRGAVIDQTIVDYTRAYRTLGLENFLTFEADEASEGFDDAKARAVTQLLQATMIMEEGVLFGGNGTRALGTTPTPAVATSTTGGTIAASQAVSVICVALTHAGFRRSSVANGVPGQVTKTNADGSTDLFGGGAAQRSANATVTTGGTSTNSVSATVAPVFGAVGYAWYAGLAGSERLFAITTLNSVVITSLPGASQLASALPAADHSVNALVYDGLLTYASDAASGSYRVALPTGTAGTGTALTSDGAGGITQLTTMFTWFWDTYRISPDALHVAAGQLQDITRIIVANGGQPLLRMTTPAEQRAGISAGFVVDQILNPITGQYVSVRVHPEAVDGTILATTSSIPYPLSGVGNIVQLKMRRDYYQLAWPLSKRRYEYGVYCNGLLQHYAPFTLGVITNIARSA